MLDFAKRVKKLEPSATLAISQKSKELKASGIDVISLAAGEPDWNPPEEMKDASINAIRDGNAHYTENSGMKTLKSLIVEKLKKDNDITVTEKNILITTGAKYGLYLTMQALVDEGDEVIVFAPYWVSYIEQIKLAGGIPKIIITSEEEGFQIDVENLENQISSRVKGIILNYPSNPTGVSFSPEELKSILNLAERKNLFIISDEIYEYFNYEGKHTSIAALNSKFSENVILINGFSKSYSIPGWRVGYVVASEEIIKKLDEIQSHSTSNPNNIAQFACIEALKSCDYFVKKMVAEYKERRDYMVDALNSIHGIRCLKPEGAFYLFPNIQYYLGKEIAGKVPNNSQEFCEIILEKANIAMVPGSAFGMDGYVRLSYTQPLSRLQEAIKRLKSILDV
ncbi:MAG: pyridoxal phosphate-dependent aminotransferase [Brevinematia bacterium]